MPDIEKIRVTLPTPQRVTVNVVFPEPLVVSVRVFPNVMERAITPLNARPTTLNEVIQGGVTLGLWP